MKNEELALLNRLNEIKYLMRKSPEGLKALEEIENYSDSNEKQFELLKELVNKANRERKIDDLMDNF